MLFRFFFEDESSLDLKIDRPKIFDSLSEKRLWLLEDAPTRKKIDFEINFESAENPIFDSIKIRFLKS